MGARLAAASAAAMVGVLALLVSSAAGQDVEPSPDPLGDFTHVAGAEMEPGGLDWVAVPLDEAEIPSRRYELTAWSAGFAFLERPQGRGAKRHAVWTSPDGLDWTRIVLSRSVKEPFWLEPYRGGLILAAEQRRGYRVHDIRMDFWRSDDGLEWRLKGTVNGRVPRSEPELAYWPAALFPLSERITMVAVGRPRYASGGHTGEGVDFVAGERRSDTVPPDVARVWTSTGGTAWRERRLRGLADGHGQLYTTAGFTGPDAAWITREGEDGALMTSPDGIRWQEAAPLPEHYEEGGPADLAWADDAVLLYGDSGKQEGSESCGNRLGMWRLDAAVGTWTEVLDRQPASVNGLSTEGPWVVATGESWCAGRWGWLLVSADGGRTWDPDLSWVGARGAGFGQIAIHDGTVVMFGRGPIVWVATLPSPASSDA